MKALLTLILCLLPLFAGARLITVAPDGTMQYTIIQYAIDAGADGDTVID